MKPSEALPNQVFQVVPKNNQRKRVGKRHMLFFRPDHIRSPKGTVPLGGGLARTLPASHVKPVIVIVILSMEIV